MQVVQCWDDGITTDIRLTACLRNVGAKATFNLNPGLHTASRGEPWDHRGTEVRRLAVHELEEVFGGFVIANHTDNHPFLAKLPLEEARREIVDGRKKLQDLFQQNILGFAYPYGSTSPEVEAMVREAGHRYARTCGTATPCFPPESPMAFHPDCHFLHPDFWTLFEQARESGTFYFWGHSYEMINQDMWTDFDEKLRRIDEDPDTEWADVQDLFST